MILKKLAILIAVVAVMASCSKDDIGNSTDGLALKTMSVGIIPGTQPLTGPWVVTGQNYFWAGSYKKKSSLPNPLSLSGGYSVSYAPGGRAFDGSFFTLNNTNSGVRGICKYSVSGSNPAPNGMISLGGGSMNGQQFEVNFHIFNNDIGYYTDVQENPGVITQFNPQSMTTNNTWNLTQAVSNALPGFASANFKHLGGKLLIRRDNTIYADVTFGSSINGLKQVVQATNFVYVAAIDAETGNLISVSTSPQEATNIGLFNDHPLVNEDPVSHAIYFATVSDMGAAVQNVPSKIFRIPNGSNSIQHFATYSSISGDKIGEFNGLYAYNNHVYTKYSSNDVRYMGGGEHGVSYRNPIWQWAVIKPSGQKRDLEIPKDNFYCYQQPRLINGEIYFIYNDDNHGGIRKIVPVNGGNGPVPTTVVSNYTPPSWVWFTANRRITGLDRL
ncbi:hypothetical protein [Flavobacterium sp. JP2137]|uniref:hypothetical protein n=1 Tax=Flavobacterium sp. JP2137 TaxID=3414510 RepID=UPI003D2FF96C